MPSTSRSASSRFDESPLVLSSREASVATSHSASRSIVCPTARVIRTIVSKSRWPSRSIAATLESASASAVLNAEAPSAPGKPSARQSRCAWSTVSPAVAATSSPVSSGTAPRIARSRSSGAVISLAGPVEELVAHPKLGLFDVGDVVELHPALLAGVGDDQGAAAEDPVEQALLVLDVADPVHRDVVAPTGEQAGAGDQPAVGEGVGRGQPVEER